MSRLLCALVVALLLTFVVGVTYPARAAAYDRVANEDVIFRLVNHARVQRGLRPMRVTTSLQLAALTHSSDMLTRDYFGHSRAEGQVIAWGKSYRGTPQTIFRSWMHSSVHRRVILSSCWHAIGVGCARGTYRGVGGAIMYTVNFGRRAQ